MTEKPEDICPAPLEAPPSQPTSPLAPPIVPAAVWRCRTTDQAEKMLNGELEGYVYQRDGHPNADALADKCRRLHSAERAAVVASGMSAMALFVLSQLRPGQRILVSRQLYGRSLQLLTQAAPQWGVVAETVDMSDLAAVAGAAGDADWLIVETIGNPLVQVADLAALAEIAGRAGARLLVDNTFASPVLCRPLERGAGLVLESVSKIINGHSDVMLGLLCGPASLWENVPSTISVWGLAASPFDCWLALRGLSTLPLRCERACDNALKAAEFLASQPQVQRVDYPGLASHCDHELASRQFGGRFGTMAAFHLAGGRAAADRFIEAARRIPFCPSLGEVSTTLAHPESTSHRGLTAEQRAQLGIEGGTIRLSLGAESIDFILDALREGLAALG